MNYNPHFDLKPCPFCGTLPKERFSIDSYALNLGKFIKYSVGCYKDQIEMYDVIEGGSSFEEVVNVMRKVHKQWNTRVEKE